MLIVKGKPYAFKFNQTDTDYLNNAIEKLGLTSTAENQRKLVLALAKIALAANAAAPTPAPAPPVAPLVPTPTPQPQTNTVTIPVTDAMHNALTARSKRKLSETMPQMVQQGMKYLSRNPLGDMHMGRF